MKLINTNTMPLYAGQLALGNDPEAPVCIVPENAALFGVCREGYSHIARAERFAQRRVLLPAYTCETVIYPFREQGWSCAYYPVDANLRMEEAPFLSLLESFRPTLVVAQLLYGMDLTDQEQLLLKKAKETGCFILEDLTHSLFSHKRYDFVDAYVGSLRKWFSVPDGGYYESAVLPAPDMDALEEKTEFVAIMKDAMYLKGLSHAEDDAMLRAISSRLDHAAAKLNRAQTELHRISDFSGRILAQENAAENERRRLENARFLYENLKDCKAVEMVYSSLKDISTGPLWFPFYCRTDRKEFKAAYLVPNGITGVGLWPVETQEVLITDTVRRIYQQILVVPCAQMYDLCDMQRIVDAVCSAE